MLLGQSVGPMAVGPGFTNCARNGFFGTNFLWRDTLLSFGRGSWGLVLFQLNIPDFVDPSWVSFPFPSRGQALSLRKVGESMRRGGKLNSRWYVKLEKKKLLNKK